MILDTRPWVFSSNEEQYWGGAEFDTREAAVAEARYHASEGGYRRMYIGRKTPPVLCIPDAEDILETVAMRTTEESGGEWSEDYLQRVSKEDEKKLTDHIRALVTDWLTETGNLPDWFNVEESETIECEVTHGLCGEQA